MINHLCVSFKIEIYLFSSYKNKYYTEIRVRVSAFSSSGSLGSYSVPHFPPIFNVFSYSFLYLQHVFLPTSESQACDFDVITDAGRAHLQGFVFPNRERKALYTEEVPRPAAPLCCLLYYMGHAGKWVNGVWRMRGTQEVLYCILGCSCDPCIPVMSSASLILATWCRFEELLGMRAPDWAVELSRWW